MEWVKAQQLKSDEAKHWLKSFENTSLDLFSDIGVFCKDYSPQSEFQLNLLSQHITAKLKFKNNLNDNSLIEIVSLINKEIYKLNITKEQKIYQYLSALVDEKTFTIYETNQKQVSLIRLRQLQNQVGFTNEEMRMLTEIAYQCPFKGGNAVYEARMMLGSIKPVIVNEEDLCGTNENNHSAKKEQQKNMLIYPNPSNEDIRIVLRGTIETEIYPGKLMDLNGRVIKEFEINNYCNLSIFALEPGMYIVSINQNPQLTSKVFIQN